MNSTMNNLDQWLQPFVVLVASLVLLSIFRTWLFKFLEKWAAKTDSEFDDRIVESLKTPSWIAIFYISISAAVPMLPRGFGQLAIIPKIQAILMIVLVSWVGLRITKLWFTRPSAFGAPLQVRMFLFRVMQIGILSLSGVMILDTMGISVTPLLASLGVGSVAVALALQDTLGNLFAGFYIQIDRPVGLNDFIRLEDGTEGTVIRIGWRSTHLQLSTGNRTIIPNTKLANSVILNYTIGNAESALVIPVGVSYDDDLRRVEKITLDVAKQIQTTIPGAKPTWEPVVRFSRFADSSIEFSVVLMLQDISHLSSVRHEFIKSLHERYRQERIDIPFPQRVVHVKSADEAPQA